MSLEEKGSAWEVDKLDELDSLHRSTVKVLVGPKGYPFNIHKEKLCKASTYFSSAFEGSFFEAAEACLQLEDVQVEVFKVFQYWLYEHKFVPSQSVEDESLHLVQCFSFGDSRQMPQFQNLVLDAIQKRAVEKEFAVPSSVGAVTLAYENTLEGNSIRKLLADIYAFNLKMDSPDLDLNSYPKDFLVDVLAINIQRLPYRLNDEDAAFDTDAKSYYVKEDALSRNGPRFRNMICPSVSRPVSEPLEPEMDDVCLTTKKKSKKAKKKKERVATASGSGTADSRSIRENGEFEWH